MCNYDMCLFHGHGEGDNGAEGNNYTELELVRMLLKKTVTYLENRDVSVLHNYDSGLNNYYNNLTKNVTLKYKMGGVLHINSEGGKGIEIICPCKETFFGVEENILQGYEKVGFFNRGIKFRNYDDDKFYTEPFLGVDWYKEIREAWNNGVSLSIIESCFIDNQEDVDRFIDNINLLAKIIANSYLKEMDKELYDLGSINDENNMDKHYRVQVGYYNKLENALKIADELKNKGYDVLIKED